MKTIAIIGTGAIGGFYGACLQKAGFEVHFLLNSDYEHVKKYGLKIDSPEGDFSLPKVDAWNSAEKMPKCDLVIVSLKTTVNHLLKDLLPPVCHDTSKVLVLQNGLGTDKDAAEAVQKCEIFGGLCAIGCNKVGPGHIKHICYNEIRLGQYLRNEEPAGITENLKAVSDVLNKAGIPTVLSEFMTEARWRKLVWNMTFNGLCTILDCNTKTIMESPEYRQRAITIIHKVIDAANASGMNIERGFADQMINLTDNMAPYLPSMKLDFENDRELEIEVIYDRPISEASKNNCPVPEITKLANELKKLVAERKG